MESVNQPPVDIERRLEEWREQARMLHELHPDQRPSIITIDLDSIEAVLDYIAVLKQAAARPGPVEVNAARAELIRRGIRAGLADVSAALEAAREVRS